MTREEFTRHLNTVLPGCDSAIDIWITWAKELEEKDSSNYELPEGTYKTQLVFLQELWDGFSQILDTYGVEVAQKVISMAQIPHCLFPWELDQAAAHLAQGRTILDIQQLSEDGLLEDFSDPAAEQRIALS